MSSGRDEWMSRWTEEDKKRNLSSYLGQIPEEFGGPVKGVTGKKYEQLEFDFAEPEDLFDFLHKSDAQLVADAEKYKRDIWRMKDEAGNYVLQAKAIISMVMDSMGNSGGGTNDDYEFALWGATELLEKAASVLE